MDLRRLLDDPAFAPPPPPPPLRAVRSTPASVAVPTGGDVLEWISKIESLKGPVARRNALERALSEVTDRRGQQELVLAASRIEIAAVLEKVDGMKSVPAKRRALEKAITDVRNDNIPDELQLEELRQLEQRLHQL
jgi:hypothetical protein